MLSVLQRVRSLVSRRQASLTEFHRMNRSERVESGRKREKRCSERTADSLRKSRTSKELCRETEMIRPTTDLIRATSWNEDELTRILIDGVREDLLCSSEVLSLTLIEVEARIEERIVMSFAESSSGSSFRNFLREEFPTIVTKLFREQRACQREC